MYRPLHSPDRRILDLLGVEVSIIQASMTGNNTTAMAKEVTVARSLGPLPLGIRGPDERSSRKGALGRDAGETRGGAAPSLRRLTPAERAF